MFTVRPARTQAPRYPVAPATFAVLLASSAAFGCSADRGDYGYEDYGVSGPLDCEAARGAVGDTLAERGWTRTPEVRDMWSPEVAYLGEALVYRKQGQTLLVAPSESQAVLGDWAGDNHPEACPVAEYRGTCDEAWCGMDQSDPCAWLIQVPCPWEGDPALLYYGTLNLLTDLE